MVGAGSHGPFGGGRRAADGHHAARAERPRGTDPGLADGAAGTEDDNRFTLPQLAAVAERPPGRDAG